MRSMWSDKLASWQRSAWAGLAGVFIMVGCGEIGPSSGPFGTPSGTPGPSPTGTAGTGASPTPTPTGSTTPNPTPTPTPTTTAAACAETYASFGMAFMNAHCIGCHGAGSGMDLSTLAAITAVQANVASRVSTNNMPPGGGLSATDKSNFATWIACNPLP